MRKSDKSYGGLLASVLRNQFVEASPLDDDYEAKFPSFLKAATKFKDDDHFLSGFVELRSMLSDTKSLDDIDILTLLQPFLLLIRSPEISCRVTSLAVHSLVLFFKYDIIDTSRPNIYQCMSQIVSALSHCRFEGSDQSQDDILLVKIIRLLESITISRYSSYLSNDSMYEIVSTCFSVAINTRRDEMLRNAAQMSLLNVTELMFSKLRHIKGDSEDPRNHNIRGMETELSSSESLPDDTIGGVSRKPSDEVSEEEDENDKQTTPEPKEQPEETLSDENFTSFGIPCMREYLIHAVDILSASNKAKFSEGTKLLALEILSRVIEIAGPYLHKHPYIFKLLADKGCHNILEIIRSTASNILLAEALKVSLSLFLNAPQGLTLQFELFFQILMDSIVSKWPSMEKDLDTMNETVFEMAERGKYEKVSLTEKEVKDLSKEFDTSKQSVSKEMIVETLSILWCRSPYIFINLFKAYDCDFERSDVALNLIKLLCRLSATDASLFTTGSVPPICMEGLLSLIDGMFERVQEGMKQHIDLSKSSVPDLLVQRSKKADFIECTMFWNKKPQKGLEKLQEKGFISNIHDEDEVAQFLYERSTRMNKTKLGELLSKPANINLLKKFISRLDFQNLRPDEALRLLLTNFRLPGEAQEIERVVECFNDRYIACQNYEDDETDTSKSETEDGAEEKVAPDKDALFVLSYSIIMLNTDLHNPNVKDPMTMEDYQKNLRGCYNGKDFPSWYTERIYRSIRDHEIVMPEDMKGTSKWLEAKWHVVMSEQGNEKNSLKSFSSSNNETLASQLQFDARIFEKTSRYIISTLVNMFDNDTHDGISIRMMSTIERCAAVAKYYGNNDIVESILEIVTHMTTLTGIKVSPYAELVEQDTPSVRLYVEKEKKAITVSKQSIILGHDFKAQVSLVALMRILKRINFRVFSQWKYVMKCILKLFENGLIKPDAFPEFQAKVGLDKLELPKPKYELIRKNQANDTGILSTFSSYLKGLSDDTPEPTEDEIDSTLSALECVKSSSIGTLFRDVSKTNSANIKALETVLIESLPSKEVKEGETFDYTEYLYLMESCVCCALVEKDSEITTKIVKTCDQILEDLGDVPANFEIRILTYELLLLHLCDSSNSDLLKKNVNRIAKAFDKGKANYVDASGSLIEPLEVLTMSGPEWCQKQLLSDPQYWKILRVFASTPSKTEEIFGIVNRIINEQPKLINSSSYMNMLGLLDEISAVGAYGAQYEQKDSKDKKSNPFAEVISTAEKSITLTQQLSDIVETDDFIQSLTKEDTKKMVSPWYPLIEALSHQCYNPCRRLRDHALKSLTGLLVSDTLPVDKLSSERIIDSACFRLLLELCKPEVIATDPKGMLKTQQDVVNLSCKIILLYKMDQTTNTASWGRLLALTNKLLKQSPKNSSGIEDEVIEIEQNAMRVNAKEIHFNTLNNLKISKSLKVMVKSVMEESDGKVEDRNGKDKKKDQKKKDEKDKKEVKENVKNAKKNEKRAKEDGGEEKKASATN